MASEVCPSKNWTLPASAAGLTIAVNVMLWPAMAGFTFDATAIDVVPRIVSAIVTDWLM